VYWVIVYTFIWSQFDANDTATVSLYAGNAQSSGNADGAATNSYFNTPIGVALHSNGILFVLDNSAAIRMISTNGIVSTIAGHSATSGSLDGFGTAAYFGGGALIALSTSGTLLYVPDKNNKRIRLVNLAGIEHLSSQDFGNDRCICYLRCRLLSGWIHYDHKCKHRVHFGPSWLFQADRTSQQCVLHLCCWHVLYWRFNELYIVCVIYLCWCDKLPDSSAHHNPFYRTHSDSYIGSQCESYGWSYRGANNGSDHSTFEGSECYPDTGPDCNVVSSGDLLFRAELLVRRE
jgi:hypothetical protein